MRKKLVTVVAVGALGLAGLAVAGPALAAGTGTKTPAAAVASRVDQLKKALAGLVTDKTLTQAQADKVATTLGAADLGRSGPGGHGGPGGMHHDLSAAATALGMTETDLRTALESGKTLAQVAKDKNVAVDTLVAALVKDAKAHITKDVADKRLTQAEADQRLADLTKRITERVNGTRPDRPARPVN